MSADDLGTRLLSEVPEESLLQTLQSLRTANGHHCYQRNKLGISSLDRILEAFVNPTTGAEETNTQWNSPQRQMLHDVPKSMRAPVIEIVGSSSCSGKTQLLLYAAAIALLPVKYRDIDLGGQEGAVVWLDTAGRLDIIRLRDVMYNCISVCVQRSNPQSSKLDDPSLQEILATSLHHLHVFRPQSTHAFTKTVENLQTYLFDAKCHLSSARRLHVMILDNISAYLCQDRMEEDKEQVADRLRASSFVQRYRDIAEGLKKVQKVFECTIVVSNWGLSPVERNKYGSRLRPHLPAVWNKFITVRLIVERDKVSKFGPGMSVEEALQDGPRRQEAVQASSFSAWLNYWDSGEWSNEILRGVERLENKGSLSFEVTMEGINFLGLEEHDP